MITYIEFVINSYVIVIIIIEEQEEKTKIRILSRYLHSSNYYVKYPLRFFLLKAQLFFSLREKIIKSFFSISKYEIKFSLLPNIILNL